MKGKEVVADKDALSLECPICETVRKPTRFNKDGSISYTCKPDHINHGSVYRWRILVDGTLVD